jgi:hypothetical protein
MTDTSGPEHGPAQPGPPGGFTSADDAFLLCLEAWDFPRHADEQQFPWKWLDRDGRLRLFDAWNRRQAARSPSTPERLRQAHLLQSRADLDRVHPSWWIRALQDEPRSVQRLVASHAAPAVGIAVREAFHLEDAEASPVAAHREAAGWVMALWTERLVGGEPAGNDEPVAIQALTRLSLREVVRLVHAAGVARVVLAGDPGGLIGPRPEAVARGRWFRDWFQEQFGFEETRPRDWAEREVQRARLPQGLSRRRQLGMLGLNTIARLLMDADPYRVRWALQHLPYPVAKRVRSLMAAGANVNEQVRLIEALILAAAWSRLTLEGRLRVEYPEPTAR